MRGHDSGSPFGATGSNGIPTTIAGAANLDRLAGRNVAAVVRHKAHLRRPGFVRPPNPVAPASLTPQAVHELHAPSRGLSGLVHP
jgi:hypothetical protein